MSLKNDMQRRLADSVGRRWLRERDESRDAGDRLATAVRDFLRGDLPQNDLEDALTRYAEDQHWGGPAMSFIVRGKHKNKNPGDLDVVTANRDE